jgi:hypothetical protein
MLEVTSCWSVCLIVPQGHHQHICTCEWLLGGVTVTVPDMTGVPKAVQGTMQMAGGYMHSQDSQ